MRKKQKRRLIRIFFISLLVVLLLGTAGLAWLVRDSLSSRVQNFVAGGGLFAKTEEEQEQLTYHLTGEKIVPKSETPVLEKKPEESGRYAEVLADPTYLEENRIYTVDPQREDEITLAFAGDILFDDEYAVMSTIKKSGNGISAGFSQSLWEEMRSKDIFMINNEFPYTDRGTPRPEKAFTFRADPETAVYLKEMGVDLVGIANNHASDYGEVSLLDTLDTLEKIEMPYTGAGRNLAEAAHPVYFIVNDTKIAFIAATQIERLSIPDTHGATESEPGVFRCWDPERLLEVIGEAKENSDFVVVFVHWGTENQTEVDWAQTEQAPKFAEAGADLIVGNHPHVLQKIDTVGGVPVLYSLGNYLFNSKTVDTCLLEATIEPAGENKRASLKKLQFLPVQQSGCKATLLEGTEKERVLAEMRRISVNVAIDENGFVQW